MSLSIKIDKKPSEEIAKLMRATVWGAENGMQYIHRDTLHKIENLINPYFLSLNKRNKVLGAIAFSKRNFYNSEIPGFYIRYFSFLKSLRSKGKLERRDSVKNATKEKVREYLSQGDFEGKSSTAFFYAYVELLNERSMRVCQDFGFEPIRKFDTMIFSRFFPKKSKNVSQIEEGDKENIRAKLIEYYSTYNMYYDYRLFSNGNYYVLKQGDEIIAGAQFTPVNWEIVNIPGLSGKIMMKLLPRLPLFSQLFNPRDYRFLGIDHIYIKSGKEDVLNELFESVLSSMGYNSALIWTDTKSSLKRDLKDLELGLLNKLKSNVPAEIIAFFANMNSVDKEKFMLNPSYIGTFDLT